MGIYDLPSVMLVPRDFRSHPPRNVLDTALIAESADSSCTLAVESLNGARRGIPP